MSSRSCYYVTFFCFFLFNYLDQFNIHKLKLLCKFLGRVLNYHNHNSFNNGRCNHRLGNIFTESELHHCTMQFQQAIKYDYDYVGIIVSPCQIFFEAARSRSPVLWPDGISFKSLGTSLPKYVLPNHNQLQKQVELHYGQNG